MIRDNVKILLDEFAKYVIEQARTNLTKGKKNASKNLYDSLEFDFNVTENSIGIDFNAEDYWEFVDKGVSGTEKKYNTPFKYTNKKPPVDAMIRFARTKRIKPRNRETGRFITNKQFGFALSNYIFKQGIKPSHFFSKPFEKRLPELVNSIGDAYGDDLDQFIRDNLK